MCVARAGLNFWEMASLNYPPNIGVIELPFTAILLEKIRDLSGEDIARCHQCGLCSASCLMASEPFTLLRKVVRLAQLDQMEVLESKDIWLCLSCSTCRVRCPRGINLVKVMEGLRQIALRKGVVKYALYCKSCRRLFLTTPILDYIKNWLEKENIKVKEEILNLCPTCKKYYPSSVMR